MRWVWCAVAAASVGTASSISAAFAADVDDTRTLVVVVTVDPKIPDLDTTAALGIIRGIATEAFADVTIVESRDAAAIFRATQPTLAIRVRVVAIPRGATRVELRSVSVVSTRGDDGEEPQRIDTTVDPSEGLPRLRAVLGESFRRSLERLFPSRPAPVVADSPGGPRITTPEAIPSRPSVVPSLPPTATHADATIPPPPQPTWSTLRIGAIGATGVSALAFGVGVWQGASANGAADDYRTAASQVDVFDAKDRSEAAAGRANAFFVTAGVALAVGGVLFLIDHFARNTGADDASVAITGDGVRIVRWASP